MLSEEYVDEIIEILTGVRNKNIIREVIIEVVKKRDKQWKTQLEDRNFVRTADEISIYFNDK